MKTIFSVLIFVLLVSGCGGGGDGSNTGGGTTVTESTTGTPAAAAVFNLAGTWTDTDTVGSNSCGLSSPAPGSSRVTANILITQSGNNITLKAPVNVLGTQTIATGILNADGTMVLTGTDSGTSITLNFKANSATMITGTSQVVATGCTFNFSNSLVKTS